MSVLGMLVSVIVILGMAYWAARFAAGRGAFSAVRPGGGMKVLGQLSLGREQKLALVQAGERWFLLGITAGSISMLAEFNAEEAASWQSGPEAPEGAAVNFREAVTQILRQKRRR